LHQFDKVEIVRVDPDKSYEALDGMVEHVKNILQELKLPIEFCVFVVVIWVTSALTYDFKCFHRTRSLVRNGSVSNFETFKRIV
jgi:seryl-tRNA synthetase